jgi:NAD(P)-dependent dehydrogenase (short-subunit alcohol dehydrogenase family)
MDLGITGKLALIAGGSKGIGLACAHALAGEGARIAIVSRSAANVALALIELPGAVGVCADLADATGALGALDQIEAQLGPVDILVNCAGAARRPTNLIPAPIARRWTPSSSPMSISSIRR